MNVRQKLSLAALCLALPAMASAQAAPAPAAEPAAAPAAAPAPAFEVKPYGFLLLTYNQQSGEAGYPEYLGKVGGNEDLKANHLSARQSRFGVTIKNGDGGFLGAKLSGKLEFDFMGGAAVTTTTTTTANLEPNTCGPTGTDACTVTSTSKSTATPSGYDSVLPRLRYAVATAEWAAGPGKATLTVGQTDGLVNSLHPELGAYIALPTFLQAGNLTRRSPQIRVGYALSLPIIDVSVEAAALSAVDAAGVTTSAGNASGMPDIEARVQGTLKPTADVKATLAVGYHTNKRTYDLTKATEQNLTSSLVGLELNVEATKYLNVRGEWFAGSGADASQGGAFADVTGTAPNMETLDTTGFWAQVVVKPIAQLWIMGGYGQETLKGTGGADDQVRAMTNFGVLSPVSKNWRLGLEYSTASYDAGGTADKVSASEIALSSRFTF